MGGVSLGSCRVKKRILFFVFFKESKTAHSVSLHDNESEKKVENFASDDVVVDPDRPLRAGDVLQTLDPDPDRTEGVGQPPEGTAQF